MSYNSTLYLLIFLPVVLILYQLFPKKKRWIVLLAAGYVFFWMLSSKLIVYLLIATAITYGIGIWLNKSQSICKEKGAQLPRPERKELQQKYKKQQQGILALGIISLVGILAVLKYYGFFAENVNLIFANTGRNRHSKIIISFK